VVLLSEPPFPPEDPPALLRSRAAPILERAGLWNPRATLWTPPSLDRFTNGLGLGRRATVLDAGCGWGALGVLLALQLPGVRVVGLDLDRELLGVGREVVTALGLERRVRLEEEDIDELDPRQVRGAMAVVGQAVLSHLPRAGAWLGALASRCSPGTVVGFVERDGSRDELAGAVAAGARATLEVERRAGAALTRWLHGAGLVDIGTAGMRASWTPAQLERRLAEGLDPVDRGLALMGGATVDQLDDWLAHRQEADRGRLQALRQGHTPRDEPDGWTMAWGTVP
jgi:2-polyprenyl-3-methyl-5-hydroxy-6-metoxy-1,4-benzoquinol methylase